MAIQIMKAALTAVAACWRVVVCNGGPSRALHDELSIRNSSGPTSAGSLICGRGDTWAPAGIRNGGYGWNRS